MNTPTGEWLVTFPSNPPVQSFLEAIQLDLVIQKELKNRQHVKDGQLVLNGQLVTTEVPVGWKNAKQYRLRRAPKLPQPASTVIIADATAIASVTDVDTDLFMLHIQQFPQLLLPMMILLFLRLFLSLLLLLVMLLMPMTIKIAGIMLTIVIILMVNMMIVMMMMMIQ